jgi:Protein of unknown function (DUF2948)
MSNAPLRLLAEDADDLAVMSAALQDAVIRVGDITFESKARRLTLGLNRFRWEAPNGGRVRSGLQLAGVLSLQARKIRRDAPEAVLELLAMAFDPGDNPGGVVTLSFAGGGDLRATVECLEAVLADVSPSWPTQRTPKHDE